jgi:hypothetical protein
MHGCAVCNMNYEAEDLCSARDSKFRSDTAIRPRVCCGEEIGASEYLHNGILCEALAGSATPLVVDLSGGHAPVAEQLLELHDVDEVGRPNR